MEMSEQLEDAWKEFERRGEISNEAEGILDYASKLKEQNEEMYEMLYKINDTLGNEYSELLDDIEYLLRQVRGE